DKITTHDGTLIGFPTVTVTTNVESVTGAMFAVNASSSALSVLVERGAGLTIMATAKPIGSSTAQSRQIM
ncbi:MAG TPA: hypothetical protein VF141_07395, partial [Chryseolinea sp.]